MMRRILSGERLFGVDDMMEYGVEGKGSVNKEGRETEWWRMKEGPVRVAFSNTRVFNVFGAKRRSDGG